jgi:hypothetical protein
MLKIEKTKILYFPYENLKGYRNLTKVKGGIFRKMNDTVETGFTFLNINKSVY